VPGAFGVSFDNPHEIVLFTALNLYVWVRFFFLINAVFVSCSVAGRANFPSSAARTGILTRETGSKRDESFILAIIASPFAAPDVLARIAVTLFGRRTTG
jgi:hypothetical protein